MLKNFKPIIIVSEVTIYDSENRKPFLEISKVELGLSIKQLYSGKFDLTTISLDGLSLGVKRDIKGNYSVKFGSGSSLTGDSDNALFPLSATFKIYTGTNHGFAFPNRSTYIKSAAEEHWNELIKFTHLLEKICVETVESGSMTKDLAILIDKSAKYLTTNQFLEAIDNNLKKKLN